MTVTVFPPKDAAEKKRLKLIVDEYAPLVRLRFTISQAQQQLDYLKIHELFSKIATHVVETTSAKYGVDSPDIQPYMNTVTSMEEFFEDGIHPRGVAALIRGAVLPASVDRKRVAALFRGLDVLQARTYLDQLKGGTPLPTLVRKIMLDTQTRGNIFSNQVTERLVDLIWEDLFKNQPLEG